MAYSPKAHKPSASHPWLHRAAHAKKSFRASTIALCRQIAGHGTTTTRRQWHQSGVDLTTISRAKPERCEICELSEEHNGRTLALDHCHKTGKFRGWLCNTCNLALGRKQLSEKMLAYLSRAA